LESALERGAPILGEIIGYGFSSNGGHISQPNVDGPVRSLKMAIKDSGLQPSDIDYVNAHATSTPGGDMNEAKALYEVFQGTNVPISSTKSMTGHECWMAGASEIVYCSLMMEYGFVAPNINFEEGDEDTSKLNIASKTLDKKIDVYLSNSFGFGGTNSTLIVKKFSL
jgi:3-oxoacyl-[acyl-carrier-protein] synthase-1